MPHTYLVKVKHEVELAHVAEELIEQLDKEVDRLQMHELIVVDVDAQREKEARVATVDDLVVAVLVE